MFLGDAMKNLRISQEELFTGYVHLGGVSMPTMVNPVLYYCGKQIIYDKEHGEFIAFEECEYCGKFELDKDNKCMFCGAPAWW